MFAAMREIPFDCPQGRLSPLRAQDDVNGEELPRGPTGMRREQALADADLVGDHQAEGDAHQS